MSFVNISAVRTADPGNVWVPKNSFRPSDPFAVVLDIQVDNSVVQDGLVFDANFQIKNPCDDPYSGSSWFTVLSDGDGVGVTSVVWTWTPVSFKWGTNFSFWVFFDHYSDAVSHISGAAQLQGIFYAEGTINIQNSDLFATSPIFWYKVRP
jgi:hypothetical protein